jgi:hypothetical protein
MLPASNMGQAIGVIVTDEYGNVEMIGDKRMVTNINAMNSYTSKISLPNISQITSKKAKVQALYGQVIDTACEKHVVRCELRRDKSYEKRFHQQDAGRGLCC